MQPKKAFEMLSTIRADLNDLSDMHVVVVWIISSIKKHLHFSKQLLPVAIHQCLHMPPYYSS